MQTYCAHARIMYHCFGQKKNIPEPTVRKKNVKERAVCVYLGQQQVNLCVHSSALFSNKIYYTEKSKLSSSYSEGVLLETNSIGFGFPTWLFIVITVSFHSLLLLGV